jgi:hypothetical protein
MVEPILRRWSRREGNDVARLNVIGDLIERRNDLIVLFLLSALSAFTSGREQMEGLASALSEITIATSNDEIIKLIAPAPAPRDYVIDVKLKPGIGVFVTVAVSASVFVTSKCSDPIFF